MVACLRVRLRRLRTQKPFTLAVLAIHMKILSFPSMRVIVAASIATAMTALGMAFVRRRHRRLQMQAGLIFTGTGCSSGLPLVQCVLEQATVPPGCKACAVAIDRGRANENWRGNVGCLLQFVDRSGRLRNVQIDCGKTFREVVTMEVYRQFKVKWLDALLLTHDHMDAIGGLDELRSLQHFDPHTREVKGSIRLLCDRRTLSRLRHCFPYLFAKPVVKRGAAAAFDVGVCQCCELDMERPVQPQQAVPSSPPFTDVAAPCTHGGVSSASAAAPTMTVPTVKRFVANIDSESFGEVGVSGQPIARVAKLNLYGLEVYALPVQHGADYICFGYGFGPREHRTVRLWPEALGVPSAPTTYDKRMPPVRHPRPGLPIRLYKPAARDRVVASKLGVGRVHRSACP